MPKNPTPPPSTAQAAAIPGASTAHPLVPGNTAFFGHPRGLATLFFTEFWERFSYYGMRGLLILFMTTAAAKGGLGMEAGRAGAIYGLYTAYVYLMGLPGGWLADRLLGQRRAVFLGGCLIALGHFSMAIHAMPTFFLGMILIVFGTGLLKPNVSTMVGELYSREDARRDAGFSIFYMGINLGATVAPFICGPLGEKVDWHWGFAAAGIGMVLGLVQYVLGGKHLGRAGLEPNAGTDPVARRKAMQIVLAALAVVAVLTIMIVTGTLPLSPQAAANATGVVIVVLVFGALSYQFFFGRLDASEKKRMIAILLLFIFSSFFWAAFEQAGSSLNLFAERLTDRHLLGWEMPASTLQSINPGFIILFSPLFAWLWIALGRRGKEPSSPTKFSLGLILVGAGFFVMVLAAIRTNDGKSLVGPQWLILTYLLHTFGELCLSPVGLSTFSKLAPHRVVSQMMGIWFLSISLGNLVGGLVAGRFESYPLPLIFGGVVATTVGAGVVLALLVRPIKRLMAGVN